MGDNGQREARIRQSGRSGGYKGIGPGKGTLCSEDGERHMFLMLGCLAGGMSQEPGEVGEVKVKSSGAL